MSNPRHAPERRGHGEDEERRQHDRPSRGQPEVVGGHETDDDGGQGHHDGHDGGAAKARADREARQGRDDDHGAHQEHPDHAHGHHGGQGREHREGEIERGHLDAARPGQILVERDGAKPPERKTASAASPWSAPRARSRSMPSAPPTVTTRAPRIGEAPRRSPTATPASATWARVSAMSESRLGTRKIPISGQMTAVMVPAAKARCMNPYWSNSGMPSGRGSPRVPTARTRRSARRRSGSRPAGRGRSSAG